MFGKIGQFIAPVDADKEQLEYNQKMARAVRQIQEILDREKCKIEIIIKPK